MEEVKKPKLEFHSTPIRYKTQFDLTYKALKIYANIVNLDRGFTYIRPKLAEIMAFYIVYGYSRETKDLIIESLNTNDKNLNQMNSELHKLRLLVRGTLNFKKVKISPEMAAMKQYLERGEDFSFLIANFRKEVE